jgi:hypothetical protein
MCLGPTLRGQSVGGPAWHPYWMRYLAPGWHFSVIVYWRIFSHCVLHTKLTGRALKDAFVSSTTGSRGGFRFRPKPAAVGWGALASRAIYRVAY